MSVPFVFLCNHCRHSLIYSYYWIEPKENSVEYFLGLECHNCKKTGHIVHNYPNLGGIKVLFVDLDKGEVVQNNKFDKFPSIFSVNLGNSALSTLKVNFGCGARQIKGFLNVDAQDLPGVDRIDDIFNPKTFQENSIDILLAIHCLEHSCRKDISNILAKWYSLLKDGGKIYISVPDFREVCKRYIYKEDMEELRGFLCGGQRNEWDFHYNVFDDKSLTEKMELVGFKDVKRYNWKNTEWSYVDSYEQAYLPKMDKVNGQLMSLNITGEK